jgi:hypothetical protein
MKIYLVMHNYDVDGGYGDAIGTTDVVAAFDNEVAANAFVEKYNNLHVYKSPYDNLYCGNLHVIPMELYNSFADEWCWIGGYFGDVLVRKDEKEKFLADNVGGYYYETDNED